MSEFRKELVTVDVHGERVTQDVYVDAESGLDVDPHSGTFRTRADTIKYIEEVYMVGKDSMQSELDRYNKWMCSGGTKKKEDPLMPQAGAVLKKVKPPTDSKPSRAPTSSAGMSDMSLIDQQCSAWKDTANAHFSDKKYHHALVLYSRVEAALKRYLLAPYGGSSIISGCDALPSEAATLALSTVVATKSRLPEPLPKASQRLSTSDTTARRSFLSICYSNSAEAHMRLARPLEAFRCAEMAVRLDSTSVKGRFRLATAAFALGQQLDTNQLQWFEEGLAACATLVDQMNESTPESVVQQVGDLERQLIAAAESCSDEPTCVPSDGSGRSQTITPIADEYLNLFGYF